VTVRTSTHGLGLDLKVILVAWPGGLFSHHTVTVTDNLLRYSSS